MTKIFAFGVYFSYEFIYLTQNKLEFFSKTKTQFFTAWVHWVENGQIFPRKEHIFFGCKLKNLQCNNGIKMPTRTCKLSNSNNVNSAHFSCFLVWAPNVFVPCACVWIYIFLMYCFVTIKFEWNTAQRKISICEYEIHSFSFIWCNSFSRFLYIPGGIYPKE